MTRFKRLISCATALVWLCVLVNTSRGASALPKLPDEIDVHFEARKIELREQEKRHLLQTANLFKAHLAPEKTCASMMASSDRYDGSDLTQAQLAFQRAETIANLLKTTGVPSTVSDVISVEPEQQSAPPHGALPIRKSHARVAVRFSPCQPWDVISSAILHGRRQTAQTEAVSLA